MQSPKMLDDLWRKMVFLVGDIRQLDSFPWVTWATHDHGVHFEEILEALPLVTYGDIGLHRDSGFLSNVAIPGFMKHGWIHTEQGVEKPMIVEAVSEGVVHRSPLYPLFSDFAMILSPKGVTEEERKGACLKAKTVRGAQYDVNFKFDIEDELKYYDGVRTVEAADDLRKGEQWIQRYDHGFSCTEVISFSWWHKREQLRIYRRKYRGKEAVVADNFINDAWEIKWLSESVTVDAARRLGLEEEGLSLIERYWR